MMFGETDEQSQARNEKCQMEAACAVANMCGLKLYEGCGKDRSKPKAVKCP